MVAAASLAVFFGGLFAIAGQSLSLLRASGQQSGATLCLQQRIEEMRRLTWSERVDAAYIRDNVLAAAPGSANAVPKLTEQITVNAYPTATAPLIVRRPALGAPVVLSSNPSLANAKMLRIDAEISWLRAGSNVKTRQFTAIMTQGGVNR